MAAISNPPSRSVPETLEVGVCALIELAEADLRRPLRRGGHVPAFWHCSAASAIDACRETEPELMLLVARRPDAEALECIGGLVEASTTTKVVVVCRRSGAGDIRKVIDAGARALLPLDGVESALLPVIEVVRAGQVSVPGPRGREVGRKVLTAREKQILGQVVLGMTNAEIAAKLFLAESTVKSHLSSAFAKLGVTSRNEATALILDPTAGVGLGILTIPSQKVAASGMGSRL